MKTLKHNIILLSLFSCLILGYAQSGWAQESSPLEVEQHPASPFYESLFPDQVVPLDTELSWTRRFNGNESFNPDETLPSTDGQLNRSAFGSASDSSIDAATGSDTDGFDGIGIVKQIKSSENKVKIEHGPIERLGMPAMTMLFRIAQPEQLSGLEKGVEVAFNVDNTAAGFTITQIERVDDQSSGSYEVTGKVKSIRAGQGKVKIEHGPIESLGMPAMTMLFKLVNPGDLDALKPDMSVEFDVINSSSGFEIARIRPISAPSDYAARGRVKSIRTAQGKVKIEHGPIDSLGMPGMTMLFKLTNPADLESLEPGMSVEFDVINGAAGFEIPRIRQIDSLDPESRKAFEPGQAPAIDSQLQPISSDIFGGGEA